MNQKAELQWISMVLFVLLTFVIAYIFMVWMPKEELRANTPHTLVIDRNVTLNSTLEINHTIEIPPIVIERNYTVTFNYCNVSGNVTEPINQDFVYIELGQTITRQYMNISFVGVSSKTETAFFRFNEKSYALHENTSAKQAQYTVTMHNFNINQIGGTAFAYLQIDR